MRRSTAPIVLADLLVLAALTVWATPALAVVTSEVVAGVLTVTSDEQDDRIGIRCAKSGEVGVNGASPGSGPVVCTSITSIDVFGGGGLDEIRLGQIDPTTFTSLTVVSVDGGPEGDDIVGSPIEDTIMGGDGNDAITIQTLDDVVDGGLGRDGVSVDVGGVVEISDETPHLASIERVGVTGSDQNDVIDASGYSGDLQIYGREGDDSLDGGSGRNRLKGGGGNDVLKGGPEHDRVSPGNGDDSVEAGAGNDFIGDNRGADDIRAGSGNDLIFQITTRGNHIEGGPGRDRLHLETLTSTRLTDHSVRFGSGQAELASIERAELLLAPDFPGTRLDAGGFSGSTYIRGQAGDDMLIGGSGRDEIVAYLGDDTLVGGSGRDRLDGDQGIDSCDGGPGRDRLIHCEGNTTLRAVLVGMLRDGGR
jgi:Ca2+-binding RTX toxin-like protein